MIGWVRTLLQTSPGFLRGIADSRHGTITTISVCAGDRLTIGRTCAEFGRSSNLDTRYLLVLGFTALLMIGGAEPANRRVSPHPAGVVEYQEVSKYSRIRVRKNGSIRTLVFVRDSGEEAFESQIDLSEPDDLRFEYLRSMFLSYGIVPKPRRVLIIGLGGGAMVHFLAKCDPEVHVDCVEIDEAVFKIAVKYFGIKPGHDGASPNIIVDDGLAFIARVKQQKEKYDVIYLDAFLKPSATTDSTGVPLAQRTKEFYQSIKDALVPDGAAVFNVNPHPGMRDDVSGFRDGFPQVYAFSLPNNSGKVVVASKVAARIPRAVLSKNLEEADLRLRPSYSLKSRLNSLDR